MKLIFRAIITGALALGLAACGTTSKTAVNTTTTGQELTDLQKAFESGAITQKEYDRQRKEILNH